MSVSIVGWAHLPFGRLDAPTLEDLIVGAGREAMAHAGIAADKVDGIWLGNLNGGFSPDIFASSLSLECDDGLRWKPAVRLENACASGSAAVYAACDAIEAKRAPVALVIGAEKMSAVSGAEVATILGQCAYPGEAGSPPGGFPGIHDCFTIAELLSYEAMGRAPTGRGHRLLEEGVVMRDGPLPCNPSGGLKAKGHPIGATGVSMPAVAAMQLYGDAGEMQVDGAALAGVFNMGGAAVASCVSILERTR